MDVEDEDMEFIVKLTKRDKTLIRDITIDVWDDKHVEVLKQYNLNDENTQEEVPWSQLHRFKPYFEMRQLEVTTLDGVPLDWKALLNETLPKVVNFRWLDKQNKDFLLDLAKDMGLSTTSDEKGESELGRMGLISRILKFVKNRKNYEAWKLKKQEARAGMSVSVLQEEAEEAQRKADEAKARLDAEEAKMEAKLADIRAKGPADSDEDDEVEGDLDEDDEEEDEEEEDEDEDLFDREATREALEALPDKKAVAEKAIEQGLEFGPRTTKKELVELILDKLDPSVSE